MPDAPPPGPAPDETGDGVLARHKWPCFVIAITLFLRFLLGTTNYLWFEYVKNSPKNIPGWGTAHLVFDLWMLLLYGGFGIYMCYQTEPAPFLVTGSTILFLSTAWGFFHISGRYETGTLPYGGWFFLGVISFLQMVICGAAVFYCGHADAVAATRGAAVVGLGAGCPFGGLSDWVGTAVAYAALTEAQWTPMWTALAVVFGLFLTADFVLQVQILSPPPRPDPSGRA